MTKLEELKKKLERYQRRHQKLLKKGEIASARYGDEFRDAQLRVLEGMIREIKGEIRILIPPGIPIRRDRGK